MHREKLAKAMITGRKHDIFPARLWPHKIISSRLAGLLGLWTGGLFIGWLQFALHAAGADELDPGRVKQLYDNGLIVPLSTILRDAQQRYQFGHLVEAGLLRSSDVLTYEIEFLDGDGELRELYYDAKSGRLQFYEIYQTGSDGTLHSIRYNAATGAPVGYEFEVIDGDGKQRRKYQYDFDTHRLQPHPGTGQTDAFTAD
jgi:hypothetical protein